MTYLLTYLIIFTVRLHVGPNATHGIAVAILSVRPSVCQTRVLQQTKLENVAIIAMCHLRPPDAIAFPA